MICAFRNLKSMTENAMIRTISPVDGSVVVERKCNTDIALILQQATEAYKRHRQTPLTTRIAIATRFLDLLDENKDALVLRAQLNIDTRVRN
jgi:acyl-CoA reductase-like NAD-dependent aldehyde dehydrogenase